MTNEAPMLNLDIGKPYEFTLKSGAVKVIIVNGSSARSDGSSILHISVNGAQGDYPTIESALGGPYIAVVPQSD